MSCIRTRQRAAVRRICLHHAARRAATASGWGRRHRTTARPIGGRA
ncbi:MULTISPECIES: hypothetical protein [unclassified Kitasatospora]|nr:hypothetical protein [Kitasatospora sp. CB01950]